jgi:uncharacterized protein
MLLYLPIAELPLNLFLLLGMGASIGFISGLFGVGGGFLLTPLLIFVGVPPAVAVASASAQIAASSVSGVLTYWRRKALDLKLGSVLVGGGLIGTLIGVLAFNQMRRLGHLDLFITISYVTLMLSIGSMMMVESLRALFRQQRGKPAPVRRAGTQPWLQRLPLVMRFERSNFSISIIPLIVLGVIIGFFGTILGIGGGFLVVPALIYLFRIPASIVVGTSLLQIVCTMLVATLLHATISQAVDILLALVLVVGGVVGAQFGARTGQILRGEHFRILLALLILLVGLRFAAELVVRPEDLFSMVSSELDR